MPTAPASPAAQSATATGQPRWFFGALARVTASAADTNGSYTMLELEMPPNLEAPLHVHYGEDEGFYVLEGSVSVHVGDEVVELEAGRHAFGPRDIPHRFVTGAGGARMLWVLTPGGFEAFVEEASVPAAHPTLPPADVQPPDDIEAIVRRHGNELLAG
jgi:mannose-6-phosphate isomerase-like protein (cupin superfamily)